MKSEAEIRARIAEMTQRLTNTVRKNNSAIVLLTAAEDALLWVLGENQEPPFSFQARVDEEVTPSRTEGGG